MVRPQWQKSAKLGSVDSYPDGRAGSALPAAQGVASEVYWMYMSERQRSDVGKASRPGGLLLRGCHAVLRTLTIE